MAKKKKKPTDNTQNAVNQQPASSKSTRRFMRTSRPLSGKVIGISISQPDNIEQYGYSAWDVNRITVRLSEALLSAGAHLVFGHDWRPDGIMAAICGMAIKSHAVEDADTGPLIQNFLAAPDTTSLSSERESDLRRRALVHIQTIDSPRLSGVANPHLDRALALSRMRFKMNQGIDARICIGGKRPQQGAKSPSGFFPGVAEEAYWAAKTGKPLLVAGFLGGVTAELIQALEKGGTGKSQSPKASSSLAVLEVKKELYKNAVALFKQEKHKEFALPPANLLRAFTTTKLDKATGGLWTQGCDAVDVDSFAAIVRQLKFPKGKS